MEETSERTERQAFDAAAKEDVLEEIVTLSSGIRLRLLGAPPGAIEQAIARIEQPSPPRILIEEKGREEENPNDPNYLRALEEYTKATALAAINVMLLLGTQLVDVPEDLQRPEDDGWVEDLNFLGIEFDTENPRARYLKWIWCYAMRSMTDQTLVFSSLRRSGATEEEVALAVDAFRNRAERRADNKRLSKQSDSNRPDAGAIVPRANPPIRRKRGRKVQ